MEREQEIKENLQIVEDEITRAAEGAGRRRSDITLIVVTKNFPTSDIEILYRLGLRDFGENREQEAREKVELLGETCPEIRWHFQGQLQRNKLASIGRWAHMVHSLDDPKYLKGLSDAAVKAERRVKWLIQLSLDPDYPQTGGEGAGGAGRAGRGGTDLPGAKEIISTFERAREQLIGLELVGVMGVAPLGIAPSLAFAQLNKAFIELSTIYPPLTILSAGMSGDFEAAIHAGATHVRIGSSILGSRA